MKAVEITDHALVRWLQRVHGVDMEFFRDELAALAQPYVEIAVKHVEVGGVWFVFHGERLVTVLDEKPGPNANMRHQRETMHECPPPEKMHWKARKRRRCR